MFLDKLRLDGRIVIQFGAAGGGMGTSTAMALAEAGATLVAVDLTEDLLKETESRIAEIGGTCRSVTGDVRSPQDILHAFDVAEEYGGASAVVNLVGGMRLPRCDADDALPGSAWMEIQALPDDIYSEIVTVNMTYVFNSAREFARRCIERGEGGTIVNFASVSALAGAPYHSVYGMAKAAVMSLTRSLAVELGPHSIRANCIVPGSTPSPLAKAAYSAAFDNITDRASRRSPLGRRVAPDEIAGAVLFFLSDLSSGITGQCLSVDAGVSANSPLGTGADYLATTNLRR
jgi:NAD(P)-dependent dehydrogenase (short-subunit alcohol dehydrogenase family)